eukprot:TRINITY_DN2859_c0_g3_i3.p1 TRINITY_DN2859_c0_g3~~TRINITY_DN2859_c0_g3_i3.p1  ORF type:complete len:448 (-),score=57.37 TRINITY_DN2859_c0_g3_i3:265-1608(-)
MLASHASVVSKVQFKSQHGNSRPRLGSVLITAKHKDGGKLKMVGMGSACVDYLAGVGSYPKPDEKIRTVSFEVQGGGNCGNAVSAAAKLGLEPYIIAKIGDDSIGDNIIREFEDVGVRTDFIVRGQNSPSPFTYIIVDKEGGSRTCIHTPSDPLLQEELQDEVIKRALEGAKLVYFDGRLTEVAIKVAQKARELQIPVLVEAERLRPNLELLLQCADYVFASSHFPFDFTGEQCRGDALISMATQLPNAKLIVNTFGNKGSLLMQRVDGEAARSGTAVLDDVIEQNILQFQQMENEIQPSAVCVSANRVNVGTGHVQVVESSLWKRKYPENESLLKQRKEEAAEKEAIRNASVSDSGYISTMSTIQNQKLLAKLYIASPAKISQDSIIDTTGAGDSFLGSLCYGLCMGKSMPEILALASVVAAVKCTVSGARGGQPLRHQFIDESLL